MKTKHIAGASIGLIALASHAGAGIVGHEKYIYDGSGNIVEKSIDGRVTKLSYDFSNRVTSTNSAGNCSELITYDAAGRPLSYNGASGKHTRQASYGYADKVIKTDSAGGETEFFYNAEGLLVAKTVAGKVTSYVWDDNVMAAEGTETFLNEDHISGGIPVISGNQNVVVSDYLGNTLSQGRSHFKSTAYGEGAEQSRFTGKPFVEELESYVFHHRLYSPETLRWNLKDPTGFPDGINNFLYVSGDPASKLDPLGTSEEVFLEEGSNRVNPNGSPTVLVRYIYKYGKYQKPEVTPGSTSFPPGSTGWTGPSAVITCNETMPTPVPSDANKLYWKNTPVNNTDTLFVTVSGTNNSQLYSTPYPMDSPEFEK